MNLHHRTPCSDCPWCKAAPAGWLGGHTAEFYADALALNEAPACHNRDHGPDDPDTAFCAGALAVAKNSCVSLDRAAGDANLAKDDVGRRDDCFSHYRLFYAHHTHGEQYVIPMLRGR